MIPSERRILYLSPYFPHPIQGGGGLLSLQRIKALSRLGEVDLVFLYDHEDYSAYSGEVRPYVKTFISVKVKLAELTKNLIFQLFSKSLKEIYVFSNNIARFLREKVKQDKYDLVWINHERMFQYSKIFKTQEKIIELHDVTSYRHKMIFKVVKNPLLKLFHLYEGIRLKHLERKIRRSNIPVLVTTKSEKLKFLPHNRIFINPIFMKTKSIRLNKMSNILFLGGLYYYPNYDGLNYFLKRIFPIINNTINDCRLIVSGKANSKRIRKFKKLKNVSFTGFIPSINDVFEKTRVLVVPLRIGTGLRIKILEALARGIPVVSTKEGCNGIDGLKDNVNILIRDNPDDFAKGVIRILSNQRLYTEISRGGQKLIEEFYSKNNTENIVKMMNKCMSST